MPKTPSSGQVIPFTPKPPEEVYFAMAAAQMDANGRLFEPEPELDLQPKEAKSG